MFLASYLVLSFWKSSFERLHLNICNIIFKMKLSSVFCTLNWMLTKDHLFMHPSITHTLKNACNCAFSRPPIKEKYNTSFTEFINAGIIMQSMSHWSVIQGSFSMFYGQPIKDLYSKCPEFLKIIFWIQFFMNFQACFAHWIALQSIVHKCRKGHP